MRIYRAFKYKENIAAYGRKKTVFSLLTLFQTALGKRKKNKSFNFQYWKEAEAEVTFKSTYAFLQICKR
jgi:hypothetical protein